jgi:hypothetical protein
MGDVPRGDRDEREDAYVAFVLPLVVLVTGVVVGALAVGFWIGCIIGGVLSAALGIGYRRWQRLDGPNRQRNPPAPGA